MDLSPSQLLDLKSWLSDNASSLTDQEAADELNKPSSFIVWRTDVSTDEVNESLDWSEVVALSTQKLLALDIFRSQVEFDASKATIRDAFVRIFGDPSDSLTGLKDISQRTATVGEKVLAQGTGTSQSPGVMGDGAEGEVTVQNVVDAREQTA